ncbi:guanine deaminase [Streptomyces sp. MST-110588]|uniref:guanine deaminase n=1 Tax=Streptomyces sp. MST-110588 TaxID=2833628 RepID=UPI001F5CAFAD|nr:guanine deaminase [Streptomyces sp. MST-110588]UNO40802.1 guanine deaminase [Streptomyces sp. MST-110588]
MTHPRERSPEPPSERSPEPPSERPRGHRPHAVSAVRGPLLRFRDDPFRTGPEEALAYESDGLLICEDGRITAVGDHTSLRGRLPAGTEPVHYPDHLISAGFVDTHTHYVQSGMVATFASEMSDWLGHHTFAEERRFGDTPYARRVAASFCEELLRNGTTTALTFAAVFPGSADALFEEASARNLRIAAGKVLMDRNAPDDLLDTAQRGYEESKALIERWHGKGRNLYAVTPRFAPSSTPEQLEAAGALWREHPGTLLHTHVSEQADEIPWVRSLFPGRRGYLDVYGHYGLLGPGAVLAHGVHLTPDERDRCARTGTALAHCPSSNLFLGSGLFRLADAKERTDPLKVGLGTDIGAGTSFSLLRTMNEAHKVARLTGYPLDGVRAFHLATRGGAQAMGLQDRIGSLEPGHEADFVVLDPKATPLLSRRASRAQGVEDLLFALALLGDDRAVRATYVAGRLAHDRYRDGDRDCDRSGNRDTSAPAL